jgi:aerobic-type carbon monoxide dehydrogenase small subunit (CoxS/CutS family)
MKHAMRLTINGEPNELLVEPYCSLLDLLRDQLHLTGTKKGCDEGDCGACTVLLQGKAVTSCMSSRWRAWPKEIGYTPSRTPSSGTAGCSAVIVRPA